MPEDIVLNAVMFGFEQIQPIIELINKLKNRINKKTIKVTPLKKQYPEIFNKVQELSLSKIKKALTIVTKLERQEVIKDIPLEFQEFHFHDGKDRKKCHLALGEGTIDLKKFKELTIKHDAWVNLEVKQASDLRVSVPYFRNLE